MLETEPGAEQQVRTAPYFCRRSESVLCKRREEGRRGGEGGSEVVSAGRRLRRGREVAQGHTHRGLMKAAGRLRRRPGSGAPWRQAAEL